MDSIQSSSSQGNFPFDPLSPKALSQMSERVDKLANLFKSLNITDTTTLLTFNEKTQTFEPRRSFSWSSMKGEAFDQFLKGVDTGNLLVDKIAEEAQALTLLQLEEPDMAVIISERTELIMEQLTRLLEITKEAKKHIATIAKQYRDEQKEDKAVKLENSSRNLFNNLNTATSLLNVHLPPEILLSELSESTPLDESDFEQVLRTFGEEIVSQAPKYRATLLQVRSSPDKGVTIPTQLIIDAREGSILKSKTNKAEVREASNQLKLFEESPPQASRPQAPWISLAFDEDQTVIKDAINPTSLRDDKNLGNNHLHNFKYQVNASGQICITCGVINTERKAEEFIEGLLVALKDRAKVLTEAKPLRVVLQQVNSFTSDSKLINRQNQMSRFIEEEIRKRAPLFQNLKVSPFQQGVPIIGHLNHALNFASILPGEKAQSQKQNLEGISTLASWLAEDIDLTYRGDNDSDERTSFLTACESAALISRQIKQVKTKLVANNQQVSSLIPSIEKFEEVSSLISESDEYADMEESPDIVSVRESLAKQMVDESLSFNPTLNEITSDTAALAKELTRLQGELKIRLQNISNIIDPHKIATDNHDMALQRHSLFLLKMLIEEQINTSQLSQITQLEIQLLFYMLQKTPIEINCKSGLDRTGLARALWDSLNIIYEELCQKMPTAKIATTELLHLILNQDTLSAELNEIQQSVAKKNSAYVANTLQLIENKEKIDFRQLVLEEIKRRYPDDPLKRENLEMALHYQDIVTQQFFATAQVVTLESTGVTGLKYGHDTKAGVLSGNPHPLKRISMFIETEDGKAIQLYDYMRSLISDEDLIRGIGQKKRFFTQAGLDLILRNSQLRGA